MEENLLDILKNSFKNCSDFVNGQIDVNGQIVHYAYIENLVNKTQVNSNVIEAIKKVEQLDDTASIKGAVGVAGADEKNNAEDIINDLLSGFVVVFLDNECKAVTCPCQGYEKRAVTEPPTSAVLKGPREGFVEDIATNLSLIRRKIKSADLKVEELKIGKYTNSKVCVIYIDSIKTFKYRVGRQQNIPAHLMII